MSSPPLVPSSPSARESLKSLRPASQPRPPPDAACKQRDWTSRSTTPAICFPPRRNAAGHRQRSHELALLPDFRILGLRCFLATVAPTVVVGDRGSFLVSGFQTASFARFASSFLDWLIRLRPYSARAPRWLR
ncbi:hypothetical protein BV25DRAFT_983670 [Artomyces pyxidatus]|uniref:Uncharacterized protein n=1 Tax=Artomyces pyxidatus TaxID=48021 RepID=A0ACB8SUE5_9AGAM|nr:hypothetical protein BV25DRAFT_983670 [Artomyces pyxidatus]